MTTTTEASVDNGVNVEALLGAREALTEAPEAAKFTWRANCKWVNGTHSDSLVKFFSDWARSKITRRSFHLTPIILKFLHPKTTGPHR